MAIFAAYSITFKINFYINILLNIFIISGIIYFIEDN